MVKEIDVRPSPADVPADITARPRIIGRSWSGHLRFHRHVGSDGRSAAENGGNGCRD